MTPEFKEAIDKLVNENNVVLFMKGNADFPMCGFSARVAQILSHLSVQYVDINVLENDEVREGMKEYSNWPTIPQLYIKGEFIGGCDIVSEMFEAGELQEMLEGSNAA